MTTCISSLFGFSKEGTVLLDSEFQKQDNELNQKGSNILILILKIGFCFFWFFLTIHVYQLMNTSFFYELQFSKFALFKNQIFNAKRKQMSISLKQL